MARRHHHPNPDLFLHRYNQIWSIQVNLEGRLAALSKGGEFSQSEEACWLFKDTTRFLDPKKDVAEFDYLLRGLLCGTTDDHDTFLALCDRVGVTYESKAHWVPLVNGRDVFFTREPTEDDPRTQITDFRREELARVRIDLPTEAGLRKALLAPYERVFHLVAGAASPEEINQIEEALIWQNFTPEILELIAQSASAGHIG